MRLRKRGDALLSDMGSELAGLSCSTVGDRALLRQLGGHADSSTARQVCALAKYPGEQHLPGVLPDIATPVISDGPAFEFLFVTMANTLKICRHCYTGRLDA